MKKEEKYTPKKNPGLLLILQGMKEKVFCDQNKSTLSPNLPAFTLNEKSAIKNMNSFRKSLRYQILKCSVCCEAWPIKFNDKAPDNAFNQDYECSRCKVDKKNPKMFSKENFMVPSTVPEELQGLTQCEEMLIARAFPLMQVYTKAGGGQLGYKGHVINLPNDIQHIADILPRYAKDVPVILFNVKGNDQQKSISFRVRREKVLLALKWLIQNNPLYKDIVIDESRLNALPVDGVLDVDSVDCENAEVDSIHTDLPP